MYALKKKNKKKRRSVVGGILVTVFTWKHRDFNYIRTDDFLDISFTCVYLR